MLHMREARNLPTIQRNLTQNLKISQIEALVTKNAKEGNLGIALKLYRLLESNRFSRTKYVGLGVKYRTTKMKYYLS